MFQTTQNSNGVQIRGVIKERTSGGGLAALNLTGMTVNLKVKRSTGTGSVSGTITDAANGKVTFTLTSTVLNVGGETYKTELEITDGSNTYREPGPDIFVRAAL